MNRGFDLFRGNRKEREEGWRGTNGKSVIDQSKCGAKFLYKPFMPLPNLADFIGHYIEVRVEYDFLTNENPTLIKRHLWGSDNYTSHSDTVCILQHSGFFKVSSEYPQFKALSVIFKVVRGRNSYTSVFRNGLKSRKHSSYEGHSLKVENIIPLESLGDNEELTQLAALMPTQIARKPRKQ